MFLPWLNADKVLLIVHQISPKSAQVAPVANMTGHRTMSPPVDHPTEVGNAEGSDDGSSYHETNIESSEDEFTTSVRKSQRKLKPTTKAFQTTPMKEKSPNDVRSIDFHDGFDRGRFPMLRRVWNFYHNQSFFCPSLVASTH